MEVPRQLLESLDDPLRSIEDFDFPTVNYTKVPFKPYSTFQERVNLHFGIMGRCNDTTTPRGQKRKCQDAGSSASKVPKTASTVNAGEK
ncbi:Ff.00g065190.m01.CDS01 [Fusarium sp. VM40]|nr:Ff.00g065190.m01.CDS01 [Fusarium sp. VM40]